jgi:hypothetical protein|tara:strand:- start:398 stop:670 length:273 start_codon:yes stop_codon:yes gene_type:complete
MAEFMSSTIATRVSDKNSNAFSEWVASIKNITGYRARQSITSCLKADSFIQQAFTPEKALMEARKIRLTPFPLGFDAVEIGNSEHSLTGS